jgi:hypothetical protein
MVVGKRLGFELFQSTFYLCRVQFHARLLGLAWLVEDRMRPDRARLLLAEDRGVKGFGS